MMTNHEIAELENEINACKRIVKKVFPGIVVDTKESIDTEQQLCARLDAEIHYHVNQLIHKYGYLAFQRGIQACIDSGIKDY